MARRWSASSSKGKRFFLEQFGVTSRVGWLPDSFGYSGALPQIMRLAGIDWFLTQKISWNRVNRFPHHTLDWVGIDGTAVFTHFPPADTYNGDLTPGELATPPRTSGRRVRRDVSLIPFGHGDGGGGPTREMLARAARSADTEGLPGYGWRRRRRSSRRPRRSTLTLHSGMASSIWSCTAAR